MTTVDVKPRHDGYASETVTLDRLGVNYVTHKNTLEPGSDFRDLVTDLGVGSVRYPGGYVTERWFDLADPNATEQTDALADFYGSEDWWTWDVTPLSDYLEWSAETGSAVTVVLPTYRYFDTQTRAIDAGAEAEVRTFVRELMGDEYGPTGELTLEIGNEYFVEPHTWTVGEFAALQATMADWVDDELRRIGERDAVTLLAQSGLPLDHNAVLASAFEGERAGTIDGVIRHLYGASDDLLRIGDYADASLVADRATWAPLLGDDFTLAVTEWNTYPSGRDADASGMERVAPLVRLFAEMMGNGVDLAHIWPAVHDVTNSALREPGASDQTATGNAFDLLIDGTLGKRMVDTGDLDRDGDTRMRSADSEVVGHTYAFEDESNSTHIFTSGVDEAVELTVDLSRFYVEGAEVTGRLLRAEPGENPTGKFADTEIVEIGALEVAGTPGSWTLDYTLQPYELLMVKIGAGSDATAGLAQPDGTINAETWRGTAVADDFRGDGANDRMLGGAGPDQLFGYGGIDTLYGDDGADALFGGDDDDALFGGAGDDRLHGGDGTDALDGGAGADVLMGGAGNDELVGGGGRDELYGDGGDDRLLGGDDANRLDGGAGDDELIGLGGDDTLVGADGSDTMWADDGDDALWGGRGDDRLDGAAGNDRIGGGTGNDHMTGGAGADRLWGDDGNDRIEGGDGDDEIQGAEGNDIINGGAGNDTLYGGNGRDTFVFWNGFGTDTIVGFGSNGEADTLDLSAVGAFADYADLVTNQLRGDGRGAVISDGEGNEIVLAGVDPDALGEGDFVF